VFRRATIIAPHREKFFAETVQNSSIHAMVAGNERCAALWSRSRWSERRAEEGQHSQNFEVHIDDGHRMATTFRRVDCDRPSRPSFLSFLLASGTRPRRRPRVHGFRGAHARSAAAYKRPTGRISLRRRWPGMAAKKKAGGKKKAAKKSSKKK